MEDRSGASEHGEGLPNEALFEGERDDSIDQAGDDARNRDLESPNRNGILSRFCHWVGELIVQDVPEDSALCEFDCQKGQCTVSEWQHCERRLSRAAGELWPEAETLKSDPAPAVQEEHDISPDAEVEALESEDSDCARSAD